VTRKISSFYRFMAIWIALTGMLGSAACTGLTGQSSSKADGGKTPGQPSTPQSNGSSGQIAVSTTQVNFGNVTVGNSTSQTVSITNTGSVDVNISAVSASGGGFGVSGGSGVTLNPTQSVNIFVSFGPGAAGSATGGVSISNSSSNPTLSVGLSGTGVVAMHTVGLTWNPSLSPVIGYYVYRGAAPSSLARLNSSADPAASYSDQGVAGGQTYIYAVTSVDSNNVESGFSNQISVTIP
jgi:Abnormal spindle-like microcephaly-assoc'd, ASPM-SPD-2-Hydin